MKKKLKPEKEFSIAFDEAIEEDKRKQPEAYDKKTYTFGDYLTGKRKHDETKKKLREAKKKSVAVIGAKGGKSPKMNRPILAALEQYLLGNPIACKLPNSTISKRFCNKIKSNPMEVIVDEQRFEVSLCEISFSVEAHGQTKKNLQSFSTVKLTFLLPQHCFIGWHPVLIYLVPCFGDDI